MQLSKFYYIFLMITLTRSLSVFAQDLDPFYAFTPEQNTQIHRVPLTLKEAILKNLSQQPAIRVSIYNIDIQKGITQTSAAPFDPVVNSQFFHTNSYNLFNVDQNVNALNLGQNLVTLDSIANAIVGNAATVIPTLAQEQALCSCPSDGSCNTNTNQSFCPPTIHTNLKAYENTMHVDAAKLFRDGTRILFALDIDQYKNPTFCPRRLNVGRATIEIDKPLLRNRNCGIDYMTELANRREVNAVRYDTLQTISQQVFNTASVYWDTLAAKKFLIAQQESEERLKQIVENVKILIQSSQLAPSDLLQPIAQLSGQIVSRLQAEQNLNDAQQQLRFTMGEWDEENPCYQELFDITDEFPTTTLNPLAFPTIFCRLFPQVYQLRFDIQASMTRETESKLLLKGAKNLELPQLDVVGRATFTDFTSCDQSRDFFSSIDFDRPQMDYTVGVVFSVPFYRNQAKGLIRQRQAEWAKNYAMTQQIKQQALADISAALKDQVNLQDEVKKAKESMDEYYQLITNEKKKLAAGYSSVFYLLNFEASLTNATIIYIQLQDQLAKNIARIRFLTGTLIQTLPTKCDVRSFIVGDAVTLPFNINPPSQSEFQRGSDHER